MNTTETTRDSNLFYLENGNFTGWSLIMLGFLSLLGGGQVFSDIFKLPEKNLIGKVFVFFSEFNSLLLLSIALFGMAFLIAAHIIKTKELYFLYTPSLIVLGFLFIFVPPFAKVFKDSYSNVFMGVFYYSILSSLFFITLYVLLKTGRLICKFGGILGIIYISIVIISILVIVFLFPAGFWKMLCVLILPMPTFIFIGHDIITNNLKKAIDFRKVEEEKRKKEEIQKREMEEQKRNDYETKKANEDFEREKTRKIIEFEQTQIREKERSEWQEKRRKEEADQRTVEMKWQKQEEEDRKTKEVALKKEKTKIFDILLSEKKKSGKNDEVK